MSTPKEPSDREGAPRPAGETAARGRPRPISLLNDSSESDHAPRTPPGEPISIDEGEVVDASDAREDLSGSTKHPRLNPREAVTAAHRRPQSAPSVASQAPPPDEGDDADESAKRHQPDEGPLPERERPFGPYTLLRRLAFGGMGEVFLARRDASIEAGDGKKAGLARLVVVKRILAHMRRDEKHRRSFLDEARLQTLLRSPHIVQVHDVGEIDGQVYLAMEHVHGPSWRALIDRCRRLKQHIPLAYIVDMMIQAAEGLSWAHNLQDATTGNPLRIVHRDINPHNVLVTYDGVVKLIDFGIAKSDLREQQTETGTIKGKFAYMSPEQSAAEPLDARSDLFALGICLYELLTLTNPFKRSNIVLSLEAIQKTIQKPPSSLRPGAAILDPLVERMLRKNPDDRFADCAEVASALRQLQHDGLIPEAKQPLPTWLRTLFAAEIQSHLRVLEETGSLVDVAVSSSVRLPRRIGQTSSFPPLRDEATVSTTQTATADTPAPSAPLGGEDRPPPAPLPPVDDVVRPENILPECHGTGPTGALTVRRRPPLLLAAATTVGAAGLVLGAWLLLRSSHRELASADAGSGAVAGVDAGAAMAAATPILVDAGPAAVAVSPVLVDGGARSDGVEAPPPVGGVDAGIPPTVREQPRRPPPTPTKKPAPDPAAAPDIVGRVAVTAEGFVVKGSRAVTGKQPTVLVVDDKEAPYKLKLRVRVDGAGTPSVAIESEPWAIVRVDHVGRGKTPVTDVALTPGKKTLLSLQRPGGATMEVSLTFTAGK